MKIVNLFFPYLERKEEKKVMDVRRTTSETKKKGMIC